MLRAMLQPGLCSVTFRDQAAAGVVQLAVQAGLRGIEWGGDVHVPHGGLETARTVARLTRDADLAVAAYGSYYLAFQKEGEADPPFEPILATAVALGAPAIRIWAGSLVMPKTAEYFGRVVQCCRRAAEAASREGIQVTLEFHRNTYTETLESTLRLLKAVDHPNLKVYWQPRNGSPLEERLLEIRTLQPRLSHIHVFHWHEALQPPFPRLPLSDGEMLWKPCLEAAAQAPGNRFALLEFVRKDTVAQFVEDARCLTGWIGAAAASGPDSTVREA